MMLARPPREGAGDPNAQCESCAQRPRLALALWIAWLAVTILAALLFGHGVGGS